MKHLKKPFSKRHETRSLSCHPAYHWCIIIYPLDHYANHIFELIKKDMLDINMPFNKLFPNLRLVNSEY